METETTKAPEPRAQKIIRLTVNNVMRVSAVEILPDGNMVVIGGDNGAGKSSVLDSIFFALGGTKGICEEPIKRGKQKATATVELNDYIVTRTWTAAGGSTLRVVGKDGVPMRAPQDVLNSLTGRLSFDPMEFDRMAEKEPRKAVDILKNVVGLDFTALDTKRLQLFDQRTQVNRDLDSARVKATAYTKDETAPAKEVSTAELMVELAKVQKHNKERHDLYGVIEKSSGDIAAYDSEIGSKNEEIRQLEKKLASVRADVTELENAKAVKCKAHQELQEGYDKTADQDEAAITNQITGADEVNKKVRNNARLAELTVDVTRLEKQSATLTTGIEEVDSSKAAALTAAKFPIPEISFNDSGVLLSGIPFAQGSTAERIRASLALGMALNPGLKIILIREGSLLDKKSLELVANMAKEKDFQVWIERVGDGPECGFIVEDGHLQGVEEAK